jgi:alpha-ribazole phosphatase
MLDLYLIRHGKTIPNAEKRYPAPGEDAPLSEEGIRQAKILNLPAGTVYSSPALRCLQTANLAGYSNSEVEPGLLEANFGVMAGHTWAELETEYGSAPAGWIAALGDPDSTAGPPGGESGAEFHARVSAWLNEFAENTVPDHTVLAFTHLGPILAALRLTVGLRAAELPPCTVVHLRRSRADWWLVELRPGL